jgi:hypothetical protein
MLIKHGLSGEYKFTGKQGVMDYIIQAGCIQFDPVDVCGKNAEIILQSRVKNFKKEILAELLYKDRLLIDYPDKQLSIMPSKNWHYFGRLREQARQGGLRFEGLKQLEEEAKNYIRENGAVSSAELPLTGKLHWNSAIHWSGSWDGEINTARAVLEQLYSAGELIIHHKKGTRKYYDLALKHIPHELEKPEPFPDDYGHIKWRVLRRIGAVGLLWNKASGAWLGINGLSTAIRNKIFENLIENGEIIPVYIEGIKTCFYCQASDFPIFESLGQSVFKPRMELIAPLDCLMWDRKLIQDIFNFSYQWEIYAPENKRKYGAYTLPVIYGETFAGRIDIACDRKTNTLLVKNIWLEDGVKNTKKFKDTLSKTLKRFADFNKCTDISISRN